ncbi:MAG: CDP-alcohol phosphatidyltransferase family protein [Phycisphaeraceae bacterium]|nr:CDP-alcohol phosphatidyltransferase family protein [Phycisphaeraceae bacterium]
MPSNAGPSAGGTERGTGGGGAPVAGWRRSLPNALTVLRLVMAAAFIAMLSAHDYVLGREARLAAVENPWDGVMLLAAGLFVVAALTDALDGYFARRWGVVSVFGRVMDPFADKVLVLGAFVLLASRGFVEDAQGVVISPHAGDLAETVRARVTVSFVEGWMVVVIIARELLVTSLRAAVEARGVSFAATTSGKAKMVLQSVCVPVVLIYLAMPVMAESEVAQERWAMIGAGVRWLVWITVLVTAWSAAPYVLRASRAMRG